MNTSLALRISFASLALAAAARADVTLPSILSDHMVLERSEKVPVWGKADPGEEVKVSLDKYSAKATADKDGKWAVSLNLRDSKSGPFTMTVEGKNQISVADVLVGEVWLASGQSNMAFPLSMATGAKEEIAASANPLLRQFRMDTATSTVPLDDCKGRWVTADPKTAGSFTAVGYYFGKRLQAELKVPVGVVNCSYGGTPVEAWTSNEALDSDPDLKPGKDRRVGQFANFLKGKESYVRAMPAWLKERGRLDKKTEDVAAFANPDAPADGWTAIKVPGPLGGGNAQHGAFWVRKETDIPQMLAGRSLHLVLGKFDSFESIYWNGEKVAQVTPTVPAPANQTRIYTIPGRMIKAGKNVLAVRFFAPVSIPEFKDAPKLGTITLNGQWQFKPEFVLPALDPQDAATAPKGLSSPGDAKSIATFLYNAMVHPILPYAIRGAIWYQGESNSGRAFQYRTALPLMITDWRKQWNQGDFPFYICQLPNYQPKRPTPMESTWAELREAQAMATALPNTECAVVIDLGDSDDIHPCNKQPVGDRLANIALARNYGKAVPFEAPVYQTMSREGGKIRVKFDHAENGLVAQPLPETYSVRSLLGLKAPLVRNSPGSEVEGFAICGANNKWVWANAKIEGDSVLVWSDQVAEPTAVRYAWADNPTCNLASRDGLPARPFRTDDLPAKTKNSKY